ncbi:zincin [Jaminaea rosea]|uniref:Zincin n=1 Tax=Jaminaea rosea TaxID=1569628 RepID=A0A316UT41_9BASI|nr:zincin [Jaminaea rosea]PWN27501.1 zincin [Jaminaea rosea]
MVSAAPFTAPSPYTPPSNLSAPPIREPSDIHTTASISTFRPRHLHLDWSIDWEAKTIAGSVEHTLTPLKDGETSLTFDASYLEIRSVELADGTKLQHELKPRHGSLGNPLVVTLPSPAASNSELKVRIHYSTTTDCTALGWLAKEQTSAKSAPFLYSQCQAIHCRSLVPIFDSPWWKITYTANVRSKYPVLMSALPVDPKDPSKFLEPATPHDAIEHPEQERTYAFSQPVHIPSYLIAIVAGHLEFASLGPRTGVWAEKPDLARAKWEFERDAEPYLTALEDMVSPYSWTRYDSVVLPPSFPYGGMENANMTTLTPALVVGDRSQCNVLLHELSHSWSGNLTSCGDWTSFWLNEGINVYLERLALQYVNGPKEGPAHRGFSYIIGHKALVDARKQYTDTPRFQRLVPVFKGGEDPDDAFSSIPYEAGSNLILHLEQTVGGLDIFLPFIKSYFKTFYDRSVVTQDFLDHLFAFYSNSSEITEKLKKVDWEAWLHGEGVALPVKMEYNDTLARQSFALADRWSQVVSSGSDPSSAGFKSSDVSSFDTDQIVVFLERLHDDPNAHVTEKYSKYLDEVYGMTSKQGNNGEVMLRFFAVALEDEKSSYTQQAASWVAKQGRMKYNRPTYRALYRINPELARKTFLENKGFYHPIAASMIEKVSRARRTLRPVDHPAGSSPNTASGERARADDARALLSLSSRRTLGWHEGKHVALSFVKREANANHHLPCLLSRALTRLAFH